MERIESIAVSGASSKQGRFRPIRDKIVPRKFGRVAKVLWPENTAAHIAAIGHTDERTGKRWLRGEHEPPTCVIIACVQEMLRPLD